MGIAEQSIRFMQFTFDIIQFSVKAFIPQHEFLIIRSCKWL
jgi:hypothetical protein